MSQSVLGTGFEFDVELVDAQGNVLNSFTCHNILPQEAVDHIAGMIRGSGPTPISTWYVGIFENNYVPQSSVTAADLQATVGESVAYDETSRITFVNTYDGIGLITNGASPAEFTMNASKNIYGAFLVSNSTKGGTSGMLLSIARFPSPQAVTAGATLRIAGGITLTPTATP